MHFIHRIAPVLLALAAFAVTALCKAADQPASALNAFAQTPDQARPVVALLLPMNAPDFAPPSKAVLDGCKQALALAEGNPVIELVRTDASPAQVMQGYEAAAERDPAVIVGPLTRSGVSALVASGEVKTLTLALNVPSQKAAMPEHLYTFTLSIGAEARQVAQLAWNSDLRNAVIVYSSTPLSTRTARAFADEWNLLGGNTSKVLEFGAGDEFPGIRKELEKSTADFIFLAASPAGARAIRPYLNNQIPVFSTSQINDGKNNPATNVDLNGIRFVDMPWLLEPDNPTAMQYRRPEALAPEMQRFYALGIDACRIADEFVNGHTDIHLDGITGTLTLKQTGHVQREATDAIFQDGAAVAFTPHTRP